MPLPEPPDRCLTTLADGSNCSSSGSLSGGQEPVQTANWERGRSVLPLSRWSSQVGEGLVPSASSISGFAEPRGAAPSGPTHHPVDAVRDPSPFPELHRCKVGRAFLGAWPRMVGESLLPRCRSASASEARPLTTQQTTWPPPLYVASNVLPGGASLIWRPAKTPLRLLPPR